eukprot:3934756-Rhodomonas_salina.1
MRESEMYDYTLGSAVFFDTEDVDGAHIFEQVVDVCNTASNKGDKFEAITSGMSQSRMSCSFKKGAEHGADHCDLEEDPEGGHDCWSEDWPHLSLEGYTESEADVLSWCRTRDTKTEKCAQSEQSDACKKWRKRQTEQLSSMPYMICSETATPSYTDRCWNTMKSPYQFSGGHRERFRTTDVTLDDSAERRSLGPVEDSLPGGRRFSFGDIGLAISN